MFSHSFQSFSKKLLISNKAQQKVLFSVKNMKVDEFGAILNDPSSRKLYQIIDVREPNELEVASLEGADILNFPLGTAAQWGVKIENGELLDATKPTICFCHHGMRSMRVATFLGNKINLLLVQFNFQFI